MTRPLKPSTRNNIVKYIPLFNSQIAEASKRLEWICMLPKLSKDHGVCIPSSYGFLPDGTLRIQMPFIQGSSLYSLLPRLNKKKRQSIRKLLLYQLFVWEDMDFVHGDISPRNIIIDNDGGFTFIDWLILLNSYEGTPKYSDRKIYSGKHSLDTDWYAVGKIIELDLGLNIDGYDYQRPREFKPPFQETPVC